MEVTYDAGACITLPTAVQDAGFTIARVGRGRKDNCGQVRTRICGRIRYTLAG